MTPSTLWIASPGSLYCQVSLTLFFFFLMFHCNEWRKKTPWEKKRKFLMRSTHTTCWSNQWWWCLNGLWFIVNKNDILEGADEEAGEEKLKNKKEVTTGRYLYTAVWLVPFYCKFIIWINIHDMVRNTRPKSHAYIRKTMGSAARFLFGDMPHSK